MKRFITIVLALAVAMGAMAAPAKKSKKAKEKPIKHYLDIHAGGGVSSWNYPLEGGSTGVGGAFALGVGYTYFFHPSVGFQTGITFTRLASTASLTQPIEWRTNPDGSALVDYMGEEYIHRTSFDGWKESQQTYLFEIPVGLRFRYFKERDSQVGLHAAVGLKLAIPMMANYAHNSGLVTHTGWYEQWQLELHDIPNRFGSEQANRQEESVMSKLNKVNAEAYAELGAAIRINKHYELYVAAFGQYMLNNFSCVKLDNRTPLGFRSSNYNYPFMSEYRGLVGTDKVGAMHPWMAGLKVGISIWPGKTEKEKKKELKKLMKQFPDMVPVKEVHDTIWIIDTIRTNDTIRVRDTIVRAAARIEPVVTVEEKKLDTLLSQSVIWFNFDDYKPILEPAYILDSVALMMKNHPDLRIHINGHACAIGADSYNQRLALKRAKAVASLLRAKGVKSDRMEVTSFGATHPYRYNADHQLEKDRRVEIIPEGYVADDETVQEQPLPQKTPSTSSQATIPEPEKKEVVKEPSSVEKKEYTKFLGTEKVKEGSRLMQIARRWYNEQLYWVYIYEANKDKLSSPQHLPVGTSLQIPDLKATVHKKMSHEQALQDARQRAKKYE